MNVQEAIATRRTAHEYAPTPVDPAAIERALSAAQWAPCHRLTFPWRFTIVGPQTRAKVTELGILLKGKRRELDDDLRARLHANFANPGALLVVSQVLVDDAFQRREDYAATACAIQNLTLSLHADGYHSKWSTGGLTTHVDTYAMMGIDPALQEIVGFLWAGEPAGPLRPPRRPNLDRVSRSVP